VELSPYRCIFYNTSLPQSVCETFKNLKNPARGEPMHNIFMAQVPDDTNKRTHSQRNYFSFRFFGNVGVPLMATLYILGLNVGLPVWLGTIPNVPNSLDNSQLSTLCHGHHVDVPLSTNYSPPPSSFFGESLATSNHGSLNKIERGRRRRRNQQPM
jgi:hypothetical protein